MNKILNALVILIVTTGSALADDAGVVKCRGITEASARLACYDAMAATAGTPKPEASKTVVQVAPRPAPVVSPQPASTNSPAATQTPPKVSTPLATVSPAVSAPAAAPAVTPRNDQFGLEGRASVVLVDAIESVIPGRFEGWDARTNITLANGQVWQIADESNRYVALNDPKVRIRRGALGAFYLEFEKLNHSPRVRRVQ